MKKRVLYVPKLDVEYTFRRLNRSTNQVVFETYRFYGEVTPGGRYILFETHKNYPVDMTLEHFSYRMRKQFVRQKDLTTGKVFYTASGKKGQRQVFKTIEESDLLEKQETSEDYIAKAIEKLSTSDVHKLADIEEDFNIDTDLLLKQLSAQQKMPEGPLKDSIFNSLKVKYDKISSYLEG